MLREKIIFLKGIFIEKADYSFTGGHLAHCLLFPDSGFAATLKDLFPPFDKFLRFTF